MSALAAPWVKENCTTIGTGNLILNSNIDTFIRFFDTVSANDLVWYTVEDQNGNREAGIGKFDGTNQLIRETIHATLVSGTFNNTNPTPVSLSGSAIVSCTFNAESYNDLISNLTLTYTGVSTGIHYGGVLSINGSDNTKVDISAGAGAILDTTDPTKPVAVKVSWDTIEGITVDALLTDSSSLFGIDIDGNVVQSAVDFDNNAYRNYIAIGGAAHIGNTIVERVYTLKVPSLNLAATLQDLTEALGLINISGNVFSANGANLQINRSAGKTFAFGQNFDIDPNNPNVVSTTASVGDSFLRIRTDGPGQGLITGSFTTMDVTQYDMNSVLTTIPNNNWVNIPLYLYPNSGVNIVKYPIAYHATKADALAYLTSESATDIPELESAVLRGWLTVVKSATALNDTAQAVFTLKV